MNETLFQALTLIIPLVFAIVFHEVAHGLTARMLGDPTAQEQNRLSLNPLRHVDPVGTVILPGILALLHLPVFGWAKPVPVNMWRMRNPRGGMMLVAAAGPATNLVLAGLGAVLLGLLVRSFNGSQLSPSPEKFVADNLINFMQINIFLALFNLLPIPPFDGSHIVEGLLPRGLAQSYAKLRRFGFALFFVLLFVLPQIIPGFDLIGRYVMPPVAWTIRQYLALSIAIGGH
ncbi:MAG: site-2 protease family protein [Novosphingobium sp.]